MDRASMRWHIAGTPLWKDGPTRVYLTRIYGDPVLAYRWLQALGLFFIALIILRLCRPGPAPAPVWQRILRASRSSNLRSPPLEGHGVGQSVLNVERLTLSVERFLHPHTPTHPYSHTLLFRRPVSLLLALLVFFSFSPPCARGDVNGDGQIDVADAMLIQQVVKEKRSKDDSVFAAGFANGDVNYDGATNATDARIIAEYAAGLRSLPEAPTGTQKFVYYHDDHLGSGNVITDREGNLVQHIEYTPFGEIRHELDLGVSINYLYTGQEFDREVGLYYYQAR